MTEINIHKTVLLKHFDEIEFMVHNKETKIKFPAAGFIITVHGLH